jgi:hypothetical protein
MTVSSLVCNVRCQRSRYCTCLMQQTSDVRHMWPLQDIHHIAEKDIHLSQQTWSSSQPSSQPSSQQHCYLSPLTHYLPVSTPQIDLLSTAAVSPPTSMPSVPPYAGASSYHGPRASPLKPLHNSPNGIAAGFFLAQHKRRLGGNKVIDRATVFRSEQ